MASTLCFFCGRETQATAGDPGLWPIYLGYFGGNGASRCYCTRCVIQRLETRDKVTRSAKQYEVITEAYEDSKKVGAQAALTWALLHYDNWLHGAYDEQDIDREHPLVDDLTVSMEDSGRWFGTHLAEAAAAIRDIYRRWKNR